MTPFLAKLCIQQHASMREYRHARETLLKLYIAAPIGSDESNALRLAVTSVSGALLDLQDDVAEQCAPWFETEADHPRPVIV